MTGRTATLQFAELLLVLLKGKVNLQEALQILAREGTEGAVRDSVVSVLSAMKKGKGFTESLKSIKRGKVFFEPIYLTLLNAAELTGNIETALERVSGDLKRKQQALDNIIKILIYPSIIVLLAIAGTIAIMQKGIPLFIAEGLLDASAVSEASRGVLSAGITLFSGACALFAVYFRVFNNDSPEFRIFYLMDLLLRSNVTLLETLSHCVMSMANTKLGPRLLEAKKELASGVAFSAAFARIKRFPPYVLGWLQVADLHGNLSEICGSVKDYYGQLEEKRRDLAARLIEPAVIVLTGIYLLIIMTTVLLPLLTRAGGIL
jgi:type II secretory pathway component PulF